MRPRRQIDAGSGTAPGLRFPRDVAECRRADPSEGNAGDPIGFLTISPSNVPDQELPTLLRIC
jgi:hypothetical protein